MPLHEAAALGLYNIWSKSREVEPALAYIRTTRTTTRPIAVVGFDSRVSTEDARNERFPEAVFRFFDRLDPELISVDERNDLRRMSAGLVPADYYRNPVMGNDVFTIGFLSHHASFGFAGEPEEELPDAPLDSLPSLLHDTGIPFLVVDLRSVGAPWLREPLRAGFLYHETRLS